MSTAAPKKRRAYIGNLRARPNLAHSLYNNLFIPYSLPVRNFPNNDGAGIVIAQPKNPSSNSKNYLTKPPSSVYALVEFTDVEYAIQVLDGVMFDGRTLRVSKEKTNFGGGGGWNKGGGFGSSRWAGDDGGGRSGNNRSFDRGNKSQQSPQQKQVQAPAKNDADYIINEKTDERVDSHISEEEAMIKEIQTTVSSEIKESSDEVNAAIACTAAMTLLSSVDAFGMESTHPEGADTKEAQAPITTNTESMSTKDFQCRCKLPLSELLAEYGEEDPDWKKPQKQQPNRPTQDVNKNDKVLSNTDFQSRCNMPLSELMAEYGEQDVDWKKNQPKTSSSSAQGRVNHGQNANSGKQQKYQKSNSRGKDDNSNNNNGMLAPFGKAPIHLELVSFGYKYGAPSYSKRGFSYAHPIPPLDVRDLDRAPGHVAKFTGLSHLVKRALLNPTSKVNNADDAEQQQQQQVDNANEGEGGDDSNTGGPKEQSPMRQRANEIADEIIKVLVEAIDEGGHGPISPLTMTISIGSEYGRHRGVVLVEHLAVVLRARLRRNDGRGFNDDESSNGPGKNGIVKQPVSVGTRHLHVEARHTDEEAFGEDLKREARKAEKIAKRRQQFDDLGWDEGSW